MNCSLRSLRRAEVSSCETSAHRSRGKPAMRLAGKVAIISGAASGMGRPRCACLRGALRTSRCDQRGGLDLRRCRYETGCGARSGHRRCATPFRGAIRRRTALRRQPGKFGQKPVAGGLDDAPAMLGNLGLGHFPAQRHRGCMRALLVGTHKPAVARDIGRENGGEPPLDPLWAQRALPCGRPASCRAADLWAIMILRPVTKSDQQLTARHLWS